MKRYNCKPCIYSTFHKGAFEKHLLTQKHQQKCTFLQSSKIVEEHDIQKEFVECSECHMFFESEELLQKHLQDCSVVLKLKIAKLENDSLKKELEFTKKELEIRSKCHNDIDAVKEEAFEFKLEALEANSQHIDKENDYHKNLLTTSMDKQTKIATSAIKLLQQHFPNAPRLEAPKEYDSFWEESEYGDREFMFTLSTWTANRSLHEHVGEKILKFIKKKDPSQQSAWALDPSRLNCAEMEDDWITDKKGDNLTEKIIKPFVDDLKERVRKIQQSGKLDVNEMTGKAMTLIHSPKFIRQILTYICARIHIDREGRLKSGKNEGRFITYVEKDEDGAEKKAVEKKVEPKEKPAPEKVDDSETVTEDIPYVNPIGFTDSDDDFIASYKQSPKRPKKSEKKKEPPKKKTIAPPKKETPKKKSFYEEQNYDPAKDKLRNDPDYNSQTENSESDFSPMRPYTKEEEAHLKKWVDDRKKGIGYKDEDEERAEEKEIVIFDKKTKKAHKEKSKKKVKKV